MKFFQRMALSCLFIASFSLASVVSAETAKQLPHYFPEGLTSTRVPADQFATYLEFLKATSACHAPNGNAPPLANIRSIKEVREVYGKKVTFNFDLWTRESDGKIYFTDYCGRKQVTEAQFAFAKEDLVAQYKEAVRSAFVDYGNFSRLIIKARADSEKKSEDAVRKELAKSVPELAHISPPVTFRELLQIPVEPFSERDFVQTEVHYTHSPYFGMVYLNTEVVFLSLQGRMMDYLIGKPAVVKHELTHGNEKLQDLIFSGAIDFELSASPFMMLLPEDQVSLLFHGYAQTFREEAEVLFGFNFKQAKEEIIPNRGDGANIRIDAAKFNQYARQLGEVKAALYKHYRDVVIPELYQHKIFWASVNTKMVDTRAVFRILAMKEFEPTILRVGCELEVQDSQKCGYMKTSQWYSAHEEELKAMTLKAFKESGTPKPGVPPAPEAGRRYDASSLQLLMKITGLDEAALQKLARKYNVDVAKFAVATPSEALDMLLPILRNERSAGKGITKEDLK